MRNGAIIPTPDEYLFDAMLQHDKLQINDGTTIDLSSQKSKDINDNDVKIIDMALYPQDKGKRG